MMMVAERQSLVADCHGLGTIRISPNDFAPIPAQLSIAKVDGLWDSAATSVSGRVILYALP